MSYTMTQLIDTRHMIDPPLDCEAMAKMDLLYHLGKKLVDENVFRTPVTLRFEKEHAMNFGNVPCTAIRLTAEPALVNRLVMTVLEPLPLWAVMPSALGDLWRLVKRHFKMPGKAEAAKEGKG